jgi:hypothetical protein
MMRYSMVYPCSQRRGSQRISQNSCIPQIILNQKLPRPTKNIYIYICLEMAKSERLISHILVRVTPPVINIAETSRTRNAKNSHLFFCIRHKYATLFYREVNTVEKYLRYESSVQVKPCKFKCQGPPKESSGRVHM